ncbi:FAD:protein FMN transferase [Roseibium sp.]|uniref:FAD:protein FMN transferase n=1 Tax=Roseibium sp. TaxID=1936156 RepID=UPI0032674BED
MMNFSRRSFILMSLALAACKRGADVLELDGSTMGTSYSIKAIDHDGNVDVAALKQAVAKSLADVNAQMSNWDPNSEVSRFNASSSSDAIGVSQDLAYVIEAAEGVKRASDGQFDITLGPVIEAWGFGANGGSARAQPSMQEIADAMHSTGQLSVSGTSVKKANPDTQIFLPSIGKGYGVDKLAATLKGFGLTDFMVEIGGDLYVAGLNTDGMRWQIGIESPDSLSRQAYQVTDISNLGMATSGDYRNYFEENGTRYSHIIDSHTGKPISHKTASVTVLAENTMLADAWSTAMLALGTDRGLEIANRLDLAVLFIDRNTSSGSKGFVSTASERFASLKA